LRDLYEEQEQAKFTYGNRYQDWISEGKRCTHQKENIRAFSRVNGNVLYLHWVEMCTFFTLYSTSGVSTRYFTMSIAHQFLKRDIITFYSGETETMA
jgi:hypothetical protein